MQFDTSIYCSIHSSEWLNEWDIEVIEWPAKALDLNVNGNMGGAFERYISSPGKQY